MSSRRHVIIGTAGHIDHGKTELVKALTGMDPDRLKEEKERGLTIDLGFAFLGDGAAIIDVPGHERFIKNMVAGVTTIDFVLFVVAADDGVMPQTREHLDILQLLGLQKGIIALTKIDLVDPEWLELVVEDIQELVKGTFLENAPIVKVSSVTGQGIPELKALLEEYIQKARARRDRGYFWMPVDRSFVVKGFGTVVTGSVLSGQLKVGDSVEILPQQRVVKVRGLQTHGHPVSDVRLGDRAAINLAGISKEEIRRGDVLATPGRGFPTVRLDARLHLLKTADTLPHNTRVRLHVGTSEIMARIRLLDCEELLPGESALVQLHLEKRTVANRGDHFVIRRYSPPLTIGGGVILDNRPPKRHRRFDPAVIERLEALEKEDPKWVILGELTGVFPPFRNVPDIARSTGLSEEIVSETLKTLQSEGKVTLFGKGKSSWAIASPELEAFEERVCQVLADFHKAYPLRPGIEKAELRSRVARWMDVQLFDRTLGDLAQKEKVVEEGGMVRLKDFRIQLDEELKGHYERIRNTLYECAYSTPNAAELSQKLSISPEVVENLLLLLRDRGEVLILQGELLFDQRRVRELRDKLVNYLREHGEITVAQFKDIIQSSRKYAVPLLEYFDSIGLTMRLEDKRVLVE